MAENTDGFCHALARYIDQHVGIPTECIADVPWQERLRLFDAGEIQLLWLCGLPYVARADGLEHVELLAAPVPAGERYRGKPVYFSDVVVRSDASYRCFLDLHGATWAFNEPLSHSGFNVVRAFLAEFGQFNGYFGRVVESGAHTVSLDLILSGTVDATAIDSTVLEWSLAQRPKLARQIRVIESIGPSPIPPWIVSRQVPADLRVRLRNALIEMNLHSDGRALLDLGRLVRFAAAEDGDYDPIRRMARKAEQVLLA